MIDFPSSPTVGQVFNSGSGPIYIWDGVAWSLVGPLTKAGWEPVNGGFYTGSASSGFILTDLSAYRDLHIKWKAAHTADVAIYSQFSTNNGSTWLSGASQYAHQILEAQGTGVGASAPISSLISIMGSTSGVHSWFDMWITDFNQPLNAFFSLFGGRYHSVNGMFHYNVDGYETGNVARNSFKIYPSAGTMIYHCFVEGIRG